MAFVKLLAPLMRGARPVYVPLDSSESELGGEDVGFKMVSPAVRTFIMSRLSKRFFYIFILALCIPCGILIALFSPLRNLGPTIPYGYGTHRAQDRPATSSSFPPKDASSSTFLWYPANGSNFHPQVAPYNEPPPLKSRPQTPLFVGFTRNNEMLQQAVLSYIAAGWPRSEIIVVDNGGTMDANPLGLLSPDNPFYLDYQLFRERYGVNILQTPTLLNFAQLQNFYLRVAVAKGWDYYFWSHQDVVVVSEEGGEWKPYKSFYQRVLDILQGLGITKETGIGTTCETGPGGRQSRENRSSPTWALKMFAFDWLTLVNVPAWRLIGAWDTFIPYYTTDCDAYARMQLLGFGKDSVYAGKIYDVASLLPSVESLLFPSDAELEATSPTDPESLLHTPRYAELRGRLEAMEAEKKSGNRNTWQGEKAGGRGEPWTYDPQAFQRVWWQTSDFGRAVFRGKWGREDCEMVEHGGQVEMWKGLHPNQHRGREDRDGDEWDEERDGPAIIGGAGRPSRRRIQTTGGERGSIVSSRDRGS